MSDDAESPSHEDGLTKHETNVLDDTADALADTAEAIENIPARAGGDLEAWKQQITDQLTQIATRLDQLAPQPPSVSGYVEVEPVTASPEPESADLGPSPSPSGEQPPILEVQIESQAKPTRGRGRWARRIFG